MSWKRTDPELVAAFSAMFSIRDPLRESIAHFWLAKFRKQCAESGVFAAAKNCRKQGLPLSLTLAMLRSV